MAGERTEQASPRRRQKAREDGDRPHSRELSAGVAFLAGTMALGWLAPYWVTGWKTAFQHFLFVGASSHTDAQIESPATNALAGGIAWMLELRSIAVKLMLPVTVVLLASLLAAVTASAGQVGGIRLYAAALQPKWARINPAENLKNLFSLRAALRLAKGLLPAALLVVLGWRKLTAQAEFPVFSLARAPKTVADAYDLLADAAWVLCMWSAVDFAGEWRSWSRRLRMSKQELREESRDADGNPHVRGRIRNIQRQKRGRAIRAEVVRASVVITNPTHYAVALSFDFATMDPPRVLTKGRNLVAEQIKSEARWAGVPIVENPPLARSLYRTVEAGDAIPFQLYAAVAGILAYLYRQQVEAQMRKQTEPAGGGATVQPIGPAANSPPRRQDEARSIDSQTKMEAVSSKSIRDGSTFN